MHIVISHAVAHAIASQLEIAANETAGPTIAYQLRLLMAMLRECPEGQAIIIEHRIVEGV